LAVVRCNLPFGIFLTVQLFSTLLQVLTIQNNAWFMVTAVQESDDVVSYWQYLWNNSMFGFVPESTWKTCITPKSVAIFFWCLSTVQLILPLMTSVAWPGSKTNYPFPTRNAVDAEVQSAEFCIKHGRRGEEEKKDFRPESSYNDFSTVWSKLVLEVLEVWGFHIFQCTYRESVASLAYASGLRYTGSMSISYPRQRIKQIMKYQQGYAVKIKDRLDLFPMGWQLQALKEFQKLARTHCNRVCFIMVCKLVLQNLQITFLTILHIQQKEKAKGIGYMNQTNVVIGMISVASLFLTFFTEFIDVVEMTVVFIHVCKNVRVTAWKLAAVAKSSHNKTSKLSKQETKPCKALSTQEVISKENTM